MTQQPQAAQSPPRRSRWRRILAGSGTFTPRGLLARAALIVAIFVVLHLLGWREDTSILSGSVAGPGQNIRLHALMGVAYAASYFAAVVLAPILILAAGILRVLLMRFEKARGPLLQITPITPPRE